MMIVANGITDSDNLSLISTSTYNVPATTVAIDNYSFNDILSRLDELEKNRRKIDYTMLSCRNCGASLEQKINDYIVKCPYCNTAYLIGTYQINDNGR